jgi:hypothetical protein
MRLEYAMDYLRDGKRIYRSTKPEEGSLCGTLEKVYGSFYLTLYDVLAEDWEYCEKIEDPIGNEDE